jgi:hypothetical protein
VIASQIESLPQQPAGAEPSQGLWAGKKGKKNGLGLFSKLLSGLLKNPGKGFPLSEGVSEEAWAAEGEAGAKSGKAQGARLGGPPGETPGGKPAGKAGGQKAFASGPGLSRSRGEGLSETEERTEGPLKKQTGTRKGEEAGETLYLLSRAEIPASELRVPEDPEGGSLAPLREGPEPGFLGEGDFFLSEDPELSGFPGGTRLSGSVPEFPGSAETAAGEEGGRNGPADGAEVFSGLEGKLAAEFSRLGENRPGPSGTEQTEKDEKRPAEARKAERRRERSLVFETRDLRSGQDAGALGLKEGAVPEGRQPSGQEIDLSVDLKDTSRASENPSSGGERTLSQAFEDILSRELHQNLNGDIVRHASVILRDGGEGLIRLSLKPDTLGNVKIRLEMAENKITGHIVVESDEALRAFEREIGALEQAFKDSGFDGADLNMSLASGDPGAEGRRQMGEQVPFFSERFAAEQAASRYDALTEKTDVLFAIGSANGLKPGNGRISVNLLI